MKKRLLSIILTVFLVLSMVPYAAFADDSIVCPACGGTVEKHSFHLVGNYWDFFKCNTCGKWAYLSGITGLKLFSAGDQQILNSADANGILNFAFNDGHLITAKVAPTGIGRKDLPGYASDDGTPSISSDGGIIWQPTWDDLLNKPVSIKTSENSRGYLYSYSIATYFENELYKGSYSYFKSVVGDYDITVGVSPIDASNPYINSTFQGFGLGDFSFSAPIRGSYSILKSPAGYYSFADRTFYYTAGTYSGIYDAGATITSTFRDVYLNPSFTASTYYYRIWLPKFKVVPYNSADKPTSQTNITINNSTWNGNIYVDNSTNLTYIYPEYTTINENNETVTNISENPIIYNQETKQYYTYDSVTNNYYYITYETAATPTPSPSPSPSPSPDPTETPSPSESPAPTPTPDPGENPTPTPTPGGGTTVTPGGDNPGSTSTPESGNKGDSSSSGWNPFKWLADLLKDIVEKILKAIWKLITSIFGFLLWLLSLVGKLFPFIPAQAITAITAGAVIVTVIRIIKFITGR